MEVTHSRLDLPAYQRGMSPPHGVVNRAPAEIWMVSHDPISMDRPINWCVHQKDSQVLIPLVPYLTSDSPDLAFAFALSLGMRVSFDVKRPIRRLHIFTGFPANEVSDEGSGRIFWQFQIGFGIVLA